MKKLEIKSIKQLLGIIPNHPGSRILQFTDEEEAFSNALNNLSISEEYEFLLNVLNEEFYQKALELYKDSEFSSVKHIKWEQRRYASPSKQYDFIFVTATVPDNHRKLFAKIIHSHIKNAGHLVLFLEKGNHKNIEEWYNFLEEHLFVAINTIDLFEDYEILIAKKMHGWGGK